MSIRRSLPVEMETYIYYRLFKDLNNKNAF